MKFIKILQAIFSKRNFFKILIFICVIVIQVAILVFSFTIFNKYIVWIFGGFGLLSLSLIVFILNNDDNPMYKLAWVVPILILPVLGSVVYLYVKLGLITNKLAKRHNFILESTKIYKKQNESVLNNIGKINPFIKTIANYTNTTSNYPIYQNTKVNYFESGEGFFESVKSELKKAKNFIFIEFFIIVDNSMWNDILEILLKKIEEGVEVRVMYDAMGCVMTLPNDYHIYLQSVGIKTKVFSEITPLISTYQNSRDHRKILVIDGKIGYTGGINIGDEYINKLTRYGHWKDTAIMLKGEAVNSLTVMFLEMWDMFQKNDSRYLNYLVDYKVKSDSFVLPYGDSPFDRDNVGEQIYLDILNNATEYVYISTPYLIIDGDLVNSLKHAAKRGVLVIIVTPFIADKKLINAVSKSYYQELVAAGVKIYEYLPGFIHAKMFVSDDNIAVVGTINLDYRSLYLHFECACLIYKDQVVKEIKDDMLNIINKSKEMTEEEIKKIPFITNIIGRIFRIFAPLM